MPDKIDKNLTDRGLLPTGTAGRLARDFIEVAPQPDVDRYRGALLAGACGDALGRPVEGAEPDEIQAMHGELRDFVPWPGWESGPAGTFTDDTQLTMWLAQAALEGGDDHPDHFARLLAERLDSIRGIGQATHRAITRLRVVEVGRSFGG